MATITPTITAEDAHTFRGQMELAVGIAKRVHIDVSDDTLAPNKLMELDKVWWPANVRADLHIMMKDPFEHLDLFRVLMPQLVIVHAEGDGDFKIFADEMHSHGIETGLALLPGTNSELLVPYLSMIDHVLIFSGQLGHFGGQVDLGLLNKAKKLKYLKPQLEIGWDGGIDTSNARALVDGGIEVLNVGGAIHRSPEPAQAYAELCRSIL